MVRITHQAAGNCVGPIAWGQLRGGRSSYFPRSADSTGIAVSRWLPPAHSRQTALTKRLKDVRL